MNLPTNERYKKVIKEYRSYAKYHIANNLKLQRKYDWALDEIDLNILDDPQFTNHYILKAEIYETMENIIAALDSINEGLRSNPTDKHLMKYKEWLVYIYSVEQFEKRRG